MPMVGNPDSFALEYHLDGDPCGVLLLGRSCFWIAGHRVGDARAITSLRDLMFRLERNRRYQSRRENAGLFSLSTDDLRAALSRASESLFARHDLNPGTESFEAWSIYVLESAKVARLAWWPHGGDVQEATVGPGLCDAVLESALAELGALYLDELIGHPGQRPLAAKVRRPTPVA